MPKTPKPKASRGSSWSWTTDGRRLLGVQKSGSWNVTATSFSSYIKLEAEAIGVHQSALWRAMAAVNFYDRLRDSGDAWRLPPLSQLEGQTSPEVLELIERHMSVLTKGDIAKLLERAADGALPRRELLASWRILGRAREGSRRGTRRAGRALECPARKPSGELLHAKMTKMLVANAAQWIGASQAAEIKVFANHNLAGRQTRSFHCFDVSVVMQDAFDKPPVLHGVEVVEGQLSNAKIQQLLAYASRVNYIWVALSTDDAERAIVALSKFPHVGVLAVSDAIEARHRPALTSSKQSEIGSYALELLLHARA